MSLNLPTPAVALAIGAHPDDIEFGGGGTLAKWSAAGTVVHHLVCTDGSKGTWDPETDQAELVVTRQREQRNAARILRGTCTARARMFFIVSFIDNSQSQNLNAEAQRAQRTQRKIKLMIEKGMGTRCPFIVANFGTR